MAFLGDSASRSAQRSAARAGRSVPSPVFNRNRSSGGSSGGGSSSSRRLSKADIQKTKAEAAQKQFASLARKYESAGRTDLAQKLKSYESIVREKGFSAGTRFIDTKQAEARARADVAREQAREQKISTRQERETQARTQSPATQRLSQITPTPTGFSESGVAGIAGLSTSAQILSEPERDSRDTLFGRASQKVKDVTGFTKSKEDFESKVKSARDTAEFRFFQRKGQIESAAKSELTKEAQVQKLLSRQQLGQVRTDLQKKVNEGELDVESANKRLESFRKDREAQLQKKISSLSKERSKSIQPKIDAESTKFGQDFQKGLTSKTITGKSDFTTSEFILQKLPGAKTIQKAAVETFKFGQEAQKERTIFSDIQKLTAGQKGLEKTQKLSKLSASLLKTSAPALKTSAGLSLGAVRAAPLAAAVGATAATGGFASARFLPALAVKAPKALKAAKVGAGVIGAAGGALAVGSAAIKESAARTDIERIAPTGELLSIGAIGIAAGKAGSRLGERAFQKSLQKFPIKTSISREEVQFVKGVRRLKIQGTQKLGRKGEFKVKFKGSGVQAIKNDRIFQTLKIKPQFLGKNLPTVKTTFRGRIEEPLRNLDRGAIASVRGVTRTGKIKKPVSFEILQRGKILGEVGNRRFATKTLEKITVKKNNILSSRLRTEELSLKKYKISKVDQLIARSVLKQSGLKDISLLEPQGSFLNKQEVNLKRQGIFRPVSDKLTSSFLDLSPVIKIGTPQFNLFPVLTSGRKTDFSIAKSNISVSSLSLFSRPISLNKLSNVITEPKIGTQESLAQTSNLKTVSSLKTPSFGFSIGTLKTPKVNFPPFVPPIGLHSGGDRIFGKKGKKAKKGKGKFLPSLIAVEQNIRGKKPKRLTGFEVRPIQL